MKTKRSLHPTDALLVGRIEVRDETPGGKPYLAWSGWCPYCNRDHLHGWVDEAGSRLDAVDHRIAHCTGESPLNHGGYYLGLDPTRKPEHRAAIAEFRRRLAAWEARKARLAQARPPRVDSDGVPVIRWARETPLGRRVTESLYPARENTAR